jgi:shikimate dehydrogenase
MGNSLSFKQEITAVFGKPVAENPTQVMVEAAYRHHGLDWRYLTLEVDPADLGDAVRGARAMGFAGFNCTIPHKVAVIAHLDGLAESARIMGAVNCVVRRGSRLEGENTDGKGFLESLRGLSDPRGLSVLIFGAGGAARAIGVEISLAGASRVRVANRGEGRGRELAELLSSRTPVHAEAIPWKPPFRVPGDVEVVINATSVGLFPDTGGILPLDLQTLRPGMIVADVIPNPPRTLLVRGAEARGCRVLDGLGMLVNQGAIGIKYWTGIDADRAVMRGALERVFGEERPPAG